MNYQATVKQEAADTLYAPHSAVVDSSILKGEVLTMLATRTESHKNIVFLLQRRHNKSKIFSNWKEYHIALSTPSELIIDLSKGNLYRKPFRLVEALDDGLTVDQTEGLLRKALSIDQYKSLCFLRPKLLRFLKHTATWWVEILVSIECTTSFEETITCHTF